MEKDCELGSLMVDNLDNCQRFLDIDDMSVLEFYLNDLHDKVIKFPIQDEEVMFLKTATESVITTLCNNIISSTEFKLKKQGIIRRNFMPFLKENNEHVEGKGKDRAKCKAEGEVTGGNILNRIPGNQSYTILGYNNRSTQCSMPQNEDKFISLEVGSEQDLITVGQKCCPVTDPYFTTSDGALHPPNRADDRPKKPTDICNVTLPILPDLGYNQAHRPTLINDENNREKLPEVSLTRTSQRNLKNGNQNSDVGNATHTVFEYQLLKVGSFYEGTKNMYPDEFDFIFLLGESYKRNEFEIILLGTFHYMLQSLIKERYRKLPLQFSHDDFGSLVLEEYCQAHGPASKLKFLYYRCNGQSYEIRTIYVDISPAYRLLQPRDVLHPRDFLFPEWYQPVISANQCLLTYSIHKSNEMELSSRVSITEYEQYFMMNIVSERHIKVYQLVKYFINGDNLHEEVKAVSKILSKELPYYKDRICGVSSYTIKVIIFHHHYSCANDWENSLSACVLDVLKDVHSCFHEEKRWVQQYLDFSPWYHNSRVWTMSTLRKPMELIRTSDTKVAKLEQHLIELIDNLQNMNKVRKNNDGDRQNLVPWSQYALDIHEHTLRKLERRKTCMTVCCLLTVITVVIVCATILLLNETY